MHIEDDRILAGTAWMNFRERTFRDRDGRSRTWAFVERVGERRAAIVIPRTAESDSLVLVLQTRVPLGRRVLEFPAGLLDPGEDPGEAALRELAEETGYRGEILSVGPGVASSPGITSEIVHLVTVRTEEKPSLDTAHEPSEDIEVLRFSPGEIGVISGYLDRESIVLDAKLAAYLDAITFRR